MHFLGVVGGFAIVKTATTQIEIREDLPALSRITLNLDVTLSPDEAKRIAAEARSQVLPHHKEVSYAELRLVNFVYSNPGWPVNPGHPGFEERSWGDLYENWQSRFAEEVRGRQDKPLSFASKSSFRRVVEQTRARILFPKITRPRANGIYSVKLEVYRRSRGKGTIP